MYDLIKPLAIKLSHFQDCGYQQPQHENISKMAALTKAVGLEELSVRGLETQRRADLSVRKGAQL